MWLFLPWGHLVPPSAPPYTRPGAHPAPNLTLEIPRADTKRLPKLCLRPTLRSRRRRVHHCTLPHAALASRRRLRHRGPARTSSQRVSTTRVKEADDEAAPT